MKRIVLLIDGTWNAEGEGLDTNVAKLDPANDRVRPRLIADRDAGGAPQVVHYNEGVGTSGGGLARWLGGAFGLGLRDIVGASYRWLCANYEPGDAITVIGFSRGSYGARALAGLIGASGIAVGSGQAEFDRAWAHYRVAPANRAPGVAKGWDAPAVAAQKAAEAAGEVHETRHVAAVAVFETVGSYGVPAGFGLAGLQNVIAWAVLGFHDTRIGDHVGVALQALAIDEHRRAFMPTFWTAPVGTVPRAHVEQTWFAGVHGNLGGGYPDGRLSNLALCWMACRLGDLTGLAFDPAALETLAAGADVEGVVYDSAQGWPLDQWFPRRRLVLAPFAYQVGLFAVMRDETAYNVGERVHWSAIAKRGTGTPPYAPANLGDPPPDRVAEKTPAERALFP
ncbi:MAG: DUF2235 domain-containing protein [Hyphomicrobiales bacterium]|nr:DUF2235 domain-containing protein [Hyphomicrobiales bacterium]MDE2016108.1 DUF2235 domain-containing protein [Hyphomicrobiales bacterium]